jgi:hypothetical protein
VVCLGSTKHSAVIGERKWIGIMDVVVGFQVYKDFFPLKMVKEKGCSAETGEPIIV